MKEINYVYTPDNFINDIISLYIDAKCIQINKNNMDLNLLRRGRNHSVSSKAEDLFAYFLQINLKQYTDENLLFFVDQKIMFIDNKTCFFPDITIIYKNKIVSMFDIKTDLGYKRTSIIEDCSNKTKFVSEIKNKQVKIVDGQDKSKIYYYQISNNVTYETVVLSDLNISKENLKKIKSSILSNNYSSIYFLSSNEHPNLYIQKNNKKIEIYDTEFNTIINNMLLNFKV